MTRRSRPAFHGYPKEDAHGIATPLFLVLPTALLVAFFFLLTQPVWSQDEEFLRGDTNGDGHVEVLLDTLFLMSYLFLDGDEPPCLDASDVNDDAFVNVADAAAILGWGFRDLEIPDPGAEECGTDPDADLGCEEEPDPCPGDARDEDPDPDYVLVVSAEDAFTDDEVTLVATLEADTDSLEVIQFGVCHDRDLLELDTSDDGVVLADDMDSADFVELTANEDGWTLASLILFLPPFESLEVVDEIDLVEATYTVLSEDEAVVEFCDTLDDPVDSIYLISEGEYVQPTVLSGGVNLLPPEPEFLRGDSDDSGVVAPILDALHILQFGFTSGPEPACMKAADVDDSGTVSAILDALFLLQYGFSSGDEPVAPGPEECGADETDDDLSCESEACL